MLIVVALAAGDGAGAAGAVGPLLEPLEPPQLHDASATTMDAARSEDRKAISLRKSDVRSPSKQG
jgi:hypothetical protein